MSKSKFKKSTNPEKPTDCVTEGMIQNVLQGVTNIVTHHVNNGRHAQILIERDDRGGNGVVRTKVVIHD